MPILFPFQNVLVYILVDSSEYVHYTINCYYCFFTGLNIYLPFGRGSALNTLRKISR